MLVTVKVDLGTDWGGFCPVYVRLAEGKSVARNGKHQEIPQHTKAP